MISGRPATGKSLIANMIARELEAIGVDCEINDDDANPLPANYIKAGYALEELKSKVKVTIDCIRVLSREPETPNS